MRKYKIMKRKYDHIEGCGNSSEAEGDEWNYFGYNHLEGYRNTSFMAFYSFLGGSYNKLGTKPEAEAMETGTQTRLFTETAIPVSISKMVLLF